MLVAVARMQAETEGLCGQIKGFIKSSSISAEIAGYEKRIQELILNINLITGIDMNFRTIRMESTLNAVHTMMSPAAVQVPQYTNNCPPASRIFQGREKILAKMQGYFAQDMEKQHIYVLHGLGGAGKTEIALKFIQESSCFTNIFFVDASTVETINTGFNNIAKLQSVGELSNDAVMKWLVTQHEDWLVFFDNADNPKLDLHKFLPRCNHGNIIITSRNPELRVYGSDSPVSGMEQEDAIALLLKSGAVQQITSSNEKRAADIVKVLWYLPLAIVQAGAFIAKFRVLDHYPDLYAQNHKRLLREKPSQSHSDYEWTVYTTWQMSFDQLSPAAAMLLQLCSFLHQEGISEDIFSRAADYDFPSFGPSETELQQPLEFLSQFQGLDGKWDAIAFLEVVTEITSFSLATFAPAEKMFSIHPLVHQWSRDILPDPEVKYCITHSIIGMSIRGIPKIYSQLASLKLLPHVDAIMQFKEFVGPDFSAAYGLLYSWARRHREAKALRISGLKRWRTLKSNNDLDTLYLIEGLGATYSKLGQLEEAEELQVMVLGRRRTILGEDHLQTLNAMHNLAITYKNLGQPQMAKELELVVLEKRRDILGADHLDTLSALQTLAHTYRELGQFQKAEELEVVVVEKRRGILGVDHLDTLKAMHYLAVTYQELSQFEDAQGLQTEVMPKFRAILGDSHPRTILSISNLAKTYRALGKVAEAWELEALPPHKEGTSVSQAPE
ncbi:P-loop containing nucleoside triphosphate hydrolase protein [Mycena metata]|uniref:P-loop containing nucleoside triphosphate hydrolase protein n=1 Tax=Mycena metata TaxID=1033252 RepID=A0AAD7JBG0_9AGAR|nr:P-loop containing nucleoside triphosphate hydrolase protein [Mycena metata]